MEAATAEAGRLRLLNDITLCINQGNTLQEVLDLVYDRLQPFVPYNRIAVALLGEEGQRLSITVARSDGKMVLAKGYAGDLRGSSLEPLLREGRPRILNDLQQYLADKPASESTRLIVKEGMRSSLTLPLLSRGVPIGVMFFSSRNPHVYGPEHEEFLGNLVGHMALAVERSRLMDQLQERTEYLENVLNSSADAIIVEDREGRVRTWNEGARLMFGYAAAEVLGRELKFLVPPGREGDLESIRRTVEEQGFVRGVESTRLAQGGRPIIVSETSTAIRNDHGRPIGRSLILRDVTHLKRMQQELVNSQSLAAVGELAATVAHEIKNPLAGISGAIQILREAIPAESGRREIVGEILDQIRRLDNTVRDLLSYARPANPVRKTVDLGEALSRAWDLLSRQNGAGKVEFVLKGAAGVTVAVDPDLLHQVWVNLFQNALEAMPKGGKLGVEVSDGSPVGVRVTDTGTGIDPGNVARLFRPFFSTKTRGTGLGLAISRKILEAHGGSIRVESHPKRGTSVILEIPR